MPRQLINPRLQLAEHARNVHVATVEPGLTIEDVQDPAFLAHVAKRIREFDHIEVRTEDKAWFAELFVIEVGPLFVKTALLRYVELSGGAAAKQATGEAAKSADAAPAAEGFTTVWKGPHKRFCVVRDSDRAIVHENAATKEDGDAWIAKHLGRAVTA